MRIIYTPLNVPPPVPSAIAAGIVAAPGSQATATVLTAQVNIVSTVAANTGVVLSILTTGRQEVFNAGAQLLTLYPTLGTLFQGQGVNVPVTLPVGGHATFTFDGTLTWYIS